MIENNILTKKDREISGDTGIQLPYSYSAQKLPERLQNERSKLKVGITGGDIIWEAGLGENAGEALPIETFFPKPTKPSLFIGVTQDFAEEIRQERQRDPLCSDLKNKMVVTKFPNIAKEVLSQRNTENVEIFPSPGKTEAIQYVFPECMGIVDVIDSGDTIRANGIEELERFYDVTIRMIKSASKMTRVDTEILDDLRERIALALQRRRMV